MISKLTIVCVAIIVSAYFDAANAACPVRCPDGWTPVGSWCVMNAGSATTASDAWDLCSDSRVLSTHEWSETDLNELSSFVSTIGSNVYAWDSAIRYLYHPFDASQSEFLYIDGSNFELPCVSPRFCKGQCHNGENDPVDPKNYDDYTQLYYRVKNGAGCAINGPDGFPDVVICQQAPL